MEKPVTRYAFLEKFSCLGSDCPDTCCAGWQMATDARQRMVFAEKAPELLAATDSEARIMRRDPVTDECVKFTSGLCGIQRDYGDNFLSDACHFYPRITRDIGGTVVMGASISCPEIARLVLEEANPFALQQITLPRLPGVMPKPLANGVSWEDAQAMMTMFMRLAQDESLTPESIMARVVHISLRLSDLPQAQWCETFGTVIPVRLGDTGIRHHHSQLRIPGQARDDYFADLPAAQSAASDPHALLYALAVLIMRGPPTKRPRLEEAIRAMEVGLDCRIGWENRDMQYDANAGRAWQQLRARWIHGGAADAVAHYLRRWIQGQLAAMNWPFAGFAGTTLAERATVLAVRYATVRLALMCQMDVEGAAPSPDKILTTMQSIARFMDHLADADLSRAIYRDAGWLNNEARLLGLVG